VEIRKGYGFTDDNIVIGTVGRLSKEKNQVMLIDAATTALGKYPQLRFLIIGSGPEEIKLKDKVRKDGLEGKVIFPGLLTDMPTAYQAMDIFTLTSLTEGIPLTILEAMAAKLPVIATKVGGIPEIIVDGKTGLLFESGNLQEFSEKLNVLIKDKFKREELANAGFQEVQEKFSLEKMLNSYRNVYKELSS
jgi:glycosyltransferase involved in cell wall biosynthesis